MADFQPQGAGFRGLRHHSYLAMSSYNENFVPDS